MGINSLVPEAEAMPRSASREAAMGDPSPGGGGGHGIIIHPQPIPHCPVSESTRC